MGANYWKDTTIAAVAAIIEPGAASPGFEETQDSEIFGNYSRMNPKKSVARAQIQGNLRRKSVWYKLFRNTPALKFKDVVLRSTAGTTDLIIHDVLGDKPRKGLGLDYRKGRPAIVYYTAKYSRYPLDRERSNENY